MKYKIQKINLAIIFTICAFFVPSISHGAVMYFETSLATTSVGDTVLVHVNVDSQGKQINAIDGIIALRGVENVILKEIRIADSDFTLWPEKPSFNSRNNSITFSGGITGALNDESLKLFDLVLEITNTNNFSIVGNNVTAYLADGKGTIEKVTVEPASLTSMKKVGYIPFDQLEKIISGDKTKPSKFTIEFGRDDVAYEGKIFISFVAEDKESGIDFYEVKEGKRDFVRSGSPYVLQSQDVTENIVVRAVDKAGNIREVSVNESPISIIVIIIIILVLLFITIVFISIFRKK